MPHSTSLIATIVVSFVLAFLLGYGARLVRLPPLVGYLLAGVLIGPFTPGIFTADGQLAAQLAEIGVILLMFGVGLHFSIRDLLAVWKLAVPGALAQILISTIIGAILGMWWGWSIGAGLLLGLALSVASTVVLMRVFEERGLLNSDEGHVAVGWLIVEDLAMILALVLLPPLAGQTPETSVASSVFLTLGKVVIFIALVLIVGQRALPWLLSQAAKTGSRELFTLAVLACSLGIAYGSAALFDVSLALGAFFAGVVLSESDLSYQAASDSLPLQDAFAVLFFVSVGMLFDPSILLREPLSVAAVLGVILLIKPLPALVVMLVSGRSLPSALAVTAGMAQIGEFSFILAGLGVVLGVLPPEGRDLILAGSLLSIALNPLMMGNVDRASFWLVTRPQLQRWRRKIPPASVTDSDLSSSPDSSPRHAVIVGHGRVGSIIAMALKTLEFPYVVIERDRRLVENLRQQGLEVIWGDAAASAVLEAAGIQHASMLILATPSGLHAHRILDTAKSLNPDIDIIVRAHSTTDLEEMDRRGIKKAVMGERELAFSMMHHTLKGCGLSDVETLEVIANFRVKLETPSREG